MITKCVLGKCNECPKKFITIKSLEKAIWDGCPNCNSGDIEVIV